MTGWEKCEQLKKIRKAIADANDIPYEIEDCEHLSDCIGTCPKCDAEAEYINTALAYRAKSGKKLVIDGLLGDMFQGDAGIESGKSNQDRWENDYEVAGKADVVESIDGGLSVDFDLLDDELPFN